MSTSPERLADFATIVLGHPAAAGVRERVQRRLFEKFRTATPVERDVINAIMDNESLFWRELEALKAETQEESPNE